MIGIILNSPRAILNSVIISARSLDSLQSVRTLLVTLGAVPLFQVLYLTGIGATTSQDRQTMAEVAIGSSMLIVAIASLESTAVMLTSDRNSGTLSAVMLSALPRPLIWAGRTAVSTAVGLLVGIIGIGVAFLILRDSRLLADLPRLLLILVVTSISCAGMSFGVGALSLRFRDSYLPANLTTSVLLVLSGAVAPLSSLPEVARIVAHVLPVTYCVEAARGVLSSTQAGAVPQLLGTGLGVGALWFFIGCFLWSIMEQRVRTKSSLELF